MFDERKLEAVKKKDSEFNDLLAFLDKDGQG